MYLIPFGRKHISFTVESEEDKTAQHQAKKWLDEQQDWWKHLRELKHEIDNHE